MGSNAFRQIVVRRSLTALLALVFLALPVAASGGSGKLRMLKGWELYSWKAGEEWRFSLLWGTNRNKFCGEARNEAAALTLEQLEAKLEELEEGEYVTWLPGLRQGNCELAYPPQDVMEQVRRFCLRLGLHLGASG